MLPLGCLWASQALIPKRRGFVQQFMRQICQNENCWPEIELEYAIDRLHASKLEQVFAILIPNRERRVDESTELRGVIHEDSRY